MKKKFLCSCIVFAIALTSCKSNSSSSASEDATKESASASTESRPAAELTPANTMNDERFVGKWVEPNPINDKEVQGFELAKDGTSQSINMETFQHKNWWFQNDSLYLVAKSIGNHTESVDTTGYKVVSVTKDSLVLKDRELILNYKRQ